MNAGIYVKLSGKRAAVKGLVPRERALRQAHGEQAPAPRKSVGGHGWLWRGCEDAERLRVRGASDAAFGEDGGDVPCWSHIESGMRRVNVRSASNALEMRHYGGGALLS